jgi:putative ABC transport system permease protein
MNWLKQLFSRRRLYSDLSDEIHGHLDEKIEELVATGMSRKDATAAARCEFGNVALIQENSREVWRWSSIEKLVADLRFGLRVLRKNPGFTAVAVLTLTLGIGSTAAIFSVVDAVLLRPLPYRDPSRLVTLYEDRTRDGFPRKEFTPANYADCKTQTQIFDEVSAIDEDFFNLTMVGGDPERLIGEKVTWNLLPMLGASPILGLVFLPEEDRPGFEHEVVISYRLWQGRFGADPSIVGRDLLLNGRKYAVVGVMPHGFSFPDKDVDLWTPIAFTSAQLASRGEHYLLVVARLQPGISVKRANTEVQVVAQCLIRQYPEIMRFADGFVAVPLQKTYTGEVRRGLIVLLAAVAFILLIACANIANLLLSRATVRQREIALRSALGARRGRIVSQLLTESALIAAAGGFFGVLLAVVSFSFLSILIPEDLSRTITLSLNFPILCFAILVAFTSTFLFGMPPALQISKTDVNDSLKEGGRGGSGVRRKNLGNLLMVGEIALSLTLLVASGLLLRSFANMRRVDPGFRPDHVLTLEIPVSPEKSPDFVRRTQLFQTVLERVRTLPGVKSAGFISVLPLTWKSGMAGFLPEGLVLPDIEYGALDRVVSPGYFETLRIPLIRGRLLDDRDGPDAPFVAAINETMARKFWPNEDAVGKRLGFDLGGGRSRRIEIVGIVGDVRQMGLNAPPKEEMYFPYWQAEGNYMMPRALAIRTTGSPMNLLSAVRQAVWSVDPSQPLSNVMTMDAILDREVEQRRVQAVLLGGLATLSLTLACVGIYGVMAYLVAQQNHEIGIRVALGAHPRSILRLILGRGAKLTVTGVGIGSISALLATRLMSSLLFGVSSIDPPTFASVAALLTFVALLACYIPAHRAMRVDPMVALRHE